MSFGRSQEARGRAREAIAKRAARALARGTQRKIGACKICQGTHYSSDCPDRSGNRSLTGGPRKPRPAGATTLARCSACSALLWPRDVAGHACLTVAL